MGSYRSWFSFWFRFIFPGGVLFFAGVWGISHVPTAVISISTLLAVFLSVSLAALLLAWRFHRDSVFFSILIIVSAWLAVGAVAGPRASSVHQNTIELIICLVAINLILFFLLRDRGLFSIYGLVRLLFIGIQIIAFLLLLKPGVPGWVGEVASYFQHGIGSVKNVPFIFIVSGLFILFYKFMKTRSPLLAGGFWSLAAAFFMLSANSSRFAGTFWGLIAVGILVVAILEQSFQLAYNDELTGLPGRRALNEFLAAMSGPMSVLMVDIDHFKRFNDRYGHDVGDQVLKLVAARLAGVRGGKAYRYGGEEFVIVFPGKSLEDVMPRAEEARASVKKAEFVLRKPWKRRKGGPKKRKGSTASGKRLSVTVSIGIAETNRRNQSPDEVIKAADKALYRAKRAGRNRVSK
ncbi:MAG: GGDEF domain-containing protein [Holophagae bacterium]|nr:GGDEF domain-containing protein [Holophagae bacterium]